MASVYTTNQGDTFDLISYKMYGDEKYMKYIAEANWPLLDTLVFEAGIEVTIPDLPEDIDEDAPFWQTEDDTDEDYYSSLESDGEDEDEEEDEDDG